MTEFELTPIQAQFQTRGKLQSIKPYGDGHINATFLVQTDQGRYILQRISRAAFSSPEEVMENIVSVTKYLKQQIQKQGGDPLRETLTLVPTNEGGSFYRQGEDYFRMYLFIEGTHTYQTVENPLHFYHAARAFGRFQNTLRDFPAGQLHETIADFHDTPKRYGQLDAAVEADKAQRRAAVADELAFVQARRDNAGVIIQALKNGQIPYRVTHNDTKLNNVMIDDQTGEGVCVIDLDTVMPGSLLFDFGDAIRFGANTAAEDERDLSKVSANMHLFEQFTKGFLEELGSSMTSAEIELLAESARIMTLECGIRFLTDYLNGDVYFHTARPEHNLERARVQFCLVKDMEDKRDVMEEIVKKYCRT